ncbi:MAG: flotillin-like protein FloA [Proteobacteria bacterium]|nr:flotillin-like protein FloA [Pseudomonadota bacterium]
MQPATLQVGSDLSMMMWLVIVVVTFFALFVFFWLIPIRLWIAALASGAHVGLFTLIAMRLRRVPPKAIVEPRISAVKAGLEIPLNLLEGHFLAGGNVQAVVNALISADKANIDLTFTRAAAIDLAGRNVFEAVQMSVNPKVITTPKVTAMAKDGIQLSAVTRITVRANIDRLVGGAGEETVIARVGEGIVSTIGSSMDHKAVLENPDAISKNVLAKGLDAGTAYEILSIDIADVDVGANIGAKLNAERAEADKQVAQAAAEGRRAMAMASEQEMKARVVEMRAKLVEAEAQVPMAMAEALHSGNLGVMDYLNLKNIAADTDMRRSISGIETDDSPKKK